MCVCVCSFSLFDKFLSSGVATMLLMLLFLTFHSTLACYNVYRFAASSLCSCCPIILYISFVYYSCVDGTEIKKTLTNYQKGSARSRKYQFLEICPTTANVKSK